MTPVETARAKLHRFIDEKGLKHTRQRELILSAFLGAGGHVSVEELLRKVQSADPGVGSATVYRTLKLFTEAGVAHERNFHDGQSRYEPALDDAHHDHLICLDCGTIFEFEDEVVEERQSAVAAAHGLALASHRHEIYGRCQTVATCVHRAAQDSRGAGAKSV
jgi:Fur family ferric uptake transcriptional regulator